MAYFEEHYEKQQDLLLEIKQAKIGREGATRAQVKSWDKQIRKLDELEKERIFILTIAAEEGWKTAAEVAFTKRGNDADKDLAKVGNPDKRSKFFLKKNHNFKATPFSLQVLKRKEKRKQDAKDEPKAKAKKGGKPFRPRPQHQGQPWMQPQMVQPPMMQPWQMMNPYPSFGGQGYPRQETRQCLNCRQYGHIARNCPSRNIPAALGAAPK